MNISHTIRHSFAEKNCINVLPLHKQCKLCSKHFVSGEPSSDKNNVDFLPTIFETHGKLLTGPLPTKSDQYQKRRHELQPFKDSKGDKFLFIRYHRIRIDGRFLKNSTLR